MKHLSRILLITLILLGGTVCFVVYDHGQQVPRFYKNARKLLQPLSGSYENVKMGRSHDDPPMIIRLASGEWYAVVLEHDCCSGAGFDAVMIKDSSGSIYTAEKNYCGYEGFHIDESPKDVESLRKALESNGYRKE